jgi:hypothetical protein
VTKKPELPVQGPNDRLWIIAPTQREADVAIIHLAVSPAAVRVATNKTSAKLARARLTAQQIVRVRPEGWSDQLRTTVDTTIARSTT